MTVIDQHPAPPHVKHWTKDEYNTLTEQGVFSGQRLYLFRGELIEMSPQLHPHAFAVMQLTAALFRAFGVDQGYKVRIQLPFDVPGDSMPEPDGLVCTAEQGARRPHPDRAVLVIEVADSSQEKDREKALEYAAAAIPEYWLVDVRERRVELYRHPVTDGSTQLGFRYSSLQLLNPSDSIELLEKPGVAVALAQFFHD
ncbi:MAG TPA: Uma2 family endonuclease [Tepidisphaeraceae bacterium]|jgi:Uma2 family endonuclease